MNFHRASRRGRRGVDAGRGFMVIDGVIHMRTARIRPLLGKLINTPVGSGRETLKKFKSAMHITGIGRE